ncbi:MAG TPA: tetratricopeptide repeat protein [Vitreimonas sp.]|uniref:tetratricopeptide repeat protein n=1 Tax=Vitreimonas sp. TaxID=3069702 RepID=UPI002D70E49B|nr:tetratricopeptide repeat protein [Vitreimonas sp.]HYD88746.1 tetratricopeptide repeat protein [Vitreimonas sp.]
MAEVFIAAPAGEQAQARGLAEALTALGFEAAAATPTDAEIGPLLEKAKAVVALWSGAEPPTWMAVLAAMALQQGKLICASTRATAAPAPFRAAPAISLKPRDRTAFKASFTALVAAINKLAPTEGKAAVLPDALIKARAALLARPPSPRRRIVSTAMLMTAGVAALFAVGFGAGRVVQAVRSGEMLATTTQADAAPTSAPLDAPALPISWQDLERKDWREAARQLQDGDRIKRRAIAGDARAQALACLGHLAGADGFLPSPTAAREYCDLSADQNEAAGLYLSWVLQRSAPHAGIDAITARERLAQAARLGWLPAQIEYAEMLSERRSMEAQAEAGRFWLAAAERGEPRGQFHYARWLRDSPAGPRDPAAALPFLERAARSDQVDALHLLATLYRDGRGVARDLARARALYDRAARQNYPPSMFNLADMLRGGSAQDRARAIQLYKALVCLRDEQQIQPMAQRRLRAMGEPALCQ